MSSLKTKAEGPAHRRAATGAGRELEKRHGSLRRLRERERERERERGEREGGREGGREGARDEPRVTAEGPMMMRDKPDSRGRADPLTPRKAGKDCRPRRRWNTDLDVHVSLSASAMSRAMAWSERTNCFARGLHAVSDGKRGRFFS